MDVTFSRSERGNFLSLEELQERCPVAFASQATHPTCSDRYVPLRTADVVDLVSTFGWLPIAAKQTGSGPRPARSLHMVVFEHPEMGIISGNTPVGVPRLILINSLDGFTKLQFFCGFFRFVCSNGLVISDVPGASSSLKVRHANTSMAEVSVLINNTLNKMQPAIEQVTSMTNMELDEEQAYGFALEALALRVKFKVPEEKSLSDCFFFSEDMLKPLHEADQGRSDLWYHFNNMQERMQKGRFCYVDKTTGKGHSLRRLSGISREIEFNRKLFGLASSMLIK